MFRERFLFQLMKLLYISARSLFPNIFHVSLKDLHNSITCFLFKKEEKEIHYKLIGNLFGKARRKESVNNPSD